VASLALIRRCSRRVLASWRKKVEARSRSLAWLGAAVLLRGSLLELVHGVAAEETREGRRGKTAARVRVRVRACAGAA
jgi:hypothetical protein